MVVLKPARRQMLWGLLISVFGPFVVGRAATKSQLTGLAEIDPSDDRFQTTTTTYAYGANNEPAVLGITRMSYDDLGRLTRVEYS